MPTLEPTAPYRLEEDSVAGAHGTHLHVRRWLPTATAVRARLVVVHGYQEHGGRYQELARALVADGLSTVAFDLRGHGRSAGSRGHVGRFADYVTDLTTVLRQPAPQAVPTFLFGHSLGGLIVLTAARTKLPALAGILVTNPYLGLAMPVPRLKRWLGDVTSALLPRLALRSGIDPHWLTHDEAILANLARDPLIIDRVTAGWYGATAGAQKALQQAPSLPCPLWLAYSDVDPIAAPAASAAYGAQVDCPDKTIVCRHGERHELLQERERLATIGLMRSWLGKRLGELCAG